MLKKILTTTLLYFVFNAPIMAETFYGKVVRVSDGDTIKVLTDASCTGTYQCTDGKKEHRIRLTEIDTPESKQPWGKKAKQALLSIVGGKVVRVEQTDVDRYGRIVGHIYVDDLWVNGQLVKTGNAWVYRRYAKSTELFSYEQEAKQNGVGLWALPEAERMPPWEWRRKK